MKRFALIVAGGVGNRMKSALPKQFLPLNGETVLMVTIRMFSLIADEIVLVLPENQIDYWKSICAQYQFNIPHQIVAGGDSRFLSVSNGLELVDENSLVAIHDGVRPCICRSVIEESYSVANELGNAITAVKVKDSLRMSDGNESKSVDRNLFYTVQTPQTFRSSLLKEVFQMAKQQNLNHFTDDASVIEHFGHKVQLIEGDYQNIKITTPEDLLIAEQIILSQP